MTNLRKANVKMNAELKNNCFEEFNETSPKKKDATLQVLLDYQESYMKLLKKYKPEIQFIQDLIDRNQAELRNLYKITIPEISRKLSEDSAVDSDMKRLWLNKFETNMMRSLKLSQRLINDFAVKKLDEFHKEAEAMLRTCPHRKI